MNYYFYDESGQVNMIYYVQPPKTMMELPHIVADDNFPNKKGFTKLLSVDMQTRQLQCEYVPVPKTLEEEVQDLKGQIEVLNKEIDLLVADSLTKVNQ